MTTPQVLIAIIVYTLALAAAAYFAFVALGHATMRPVAGPANY